MKAQQWFTHPVGLTVSAVLSTLLWGSATPAVKIGYAELNIASNQTFEQWVFAGYRFTLAGIILVLFGWLMNKLSHQSDSSILASARLKWFRVTRLSLLQTFLQYICFYIGLSLSTGIQGAIITGSTSFFQMLVVRFMDKNERFTSNKTMGLILGFSGVAVVTIAQAGMNMELNIGDFFLILSAFFGGFGNVLSRHESRDLPVIWLTGRQMLLGGIGLTIVGSLRAGLFPFQWDSGTLLLLVYLSFLSAAAFTLWNLVMKYNSVGKVSMYLFLIPVFGVILSALLLDEQINQWTILSLVLVVAGIITVNRPSRKASSAINQSAGQVTDQAG
ncbi:DMT family transporter [Paenibacillus marinisediminis]